MTSAYNSIVEGFDNTNPLVSKGYSGIGNATYVNAHNVQTELASQTLSTTNATLEIATAQIMANRSQTIYSLYLGLMTVLVIVIICIFTNVNPLIPIGVILLVAFIFSSIPYFLIALAIIIVGWVWSMK